MPLAYVKGADVWWEDDVSLTARSYTLITRPGTATAGKLNMAW